MINLLLIAHIIVALIIISLVLLQHGKGADMGASFGGGASKTVFGSRGAAPFLMKMTGFFAMIFFVTSLTMGYLTSENINNQNTLTGPAPINNVAGESKSSDQNTKSMPASDPAIDELKSQSVPMSDDSGNQSSKSSENNSKSTSENNPLDQLK